jgi:phosphoribosylaminoimidazolecarboxamide formyltransferase / IMP cyclohydrolase
MPSTRRAIISTSDKTGVAEFGRRLVDLGFELLSTGGTAKVLADAGLPVTKVSEYTGAPEILGGRVKTLHPRIHGGLLGRPDREDDRADLEANDIGPIEVVAVNLYPFRETVARGASLEEAVENIDIGGPTMIRASAKNFEHVAVVVDPADYDAVAAGLESGALDRASRYRLSRKAFAHTAAYDAAIAEYLTARAEPEAEPSVFPDVFARTWQKAQDLRYGENPHQRAAFYVEDGPSAEPLIAKAVQLQGKELSFNNLLDADAALELVKEFDETAAVVIKHTNPCGVATAPVLSDAYRRARACDEVSAFGGVVALRGVVDRETAEALAETFLEIVVAPGFDDAAREVLSAKKNLRLLALPALAEAKASWNAGGLDLKRVGGGLLVQDRNLLLFGDEEPKVVTKRAPTDEEWRALRFGWRVVKHVKSNAIVFASADQAVGVGAGQMSRVDSSRIAAHRAALPLKGTAVASDAFFPFRDGVDAAAEAGATAVIQPGGSKRDDEVIAAADAHGMAMVLTGVRHFRH